MVFHACTYMLIVLVVNLTVSSGCFVCSRPIGSHNIDQCDMTKANVALLKTNVYEPARFLAIVKRTITYPEIVPDDKYTISCIKVTNLDAGDNGGYPMLLSGGVGSYSAQILLISQRGQPLNFRIEIWGNNAILQ